MFGRYLFPWQSLSLLLVNSLLSSADQVVYLERLGLPNGDANVIDEPLFNPKTINASVGEKIHFQARFSDVSSAPGGDFAPFLWAFGESEYSSPCPFTASGIYSGNFYIDPQGTWNGTGFTITVNDTNPHFFHSITPIFVTNCLLLANLSVIAQFPDSVDELFALNPGNGESFDGYKEMLIKQNAAMSFEYFPQGGELFVQSSMGYETVNSTTLSGTPTTANATTGNVPTPKIATPTPATEQNTATGYSIGALAGGIVGAAVGGFLLGALALWALYNRRSNPAKAQDNSSAEGLLPAPGTREEAEAMEERVLAGARLGNSA